MLTILCDNDGVLVDTEGLYFRATEEVLRTVGVPLTADQFKEISLRRGESTFVLAAERGIMRWFPRFSFSLPSDLPRIGLRG